MASFRGPLPEYQRSNPGAAYLQGRAMRQAYEQEQEDRTRANEQQILENAMELAGIQQKQQKIGIEQQAEGRLQRKQGVDELSKFGEMRQDQYDERRARKQEIRDQEAHDREMRKPLSEPKAPTAAQSKAAGFGIRIEESNVIFDTLEAGGDQFTGMLERFDRSMPNRLRSEAAQQFDQATRNYINAVLRRESGAVISPTEFEEADLQYIPQGGDGAKVLAQKKRNRQMQQASLIAEASTALGAVRGQLKSIIQQSDAARLEVIFGPK